MLTEHRESGMDKPKPDSGRDLQMEFLNGSVRKELGLESIDLQAGLKIASNYMKRGAYIEALRTYTALVLCEPMNVDFQVGLANCALQINEDHMAMQAASAVIALAPSDPRGYFLSGKACLALGHHAEASEDLQDAVNFGRKAREAAIVEEASMLLQKLASMRS